MKLTKRDRKQLETILCNMKRARAYLDRPEVVGIAIAVKSPNGGDYTLRNPQCIDTCADLTAEHIRPMNKHIGSDIAGLATAISQLEQLITPEVDECQAQAGPLPGE